MNNLDLDQLAGIKKDYERLSPELKIKFILEKACQNKIYDYLCPPEANEFWKSD